MIKYLLIDFTFKSVLPETLIYTASLLSREYGVAEQTIYKIRSEEDINRLFKKEIGNLDSSTTILLWQQDWLSSAGGFLLIDCAKKLKEAFPESTIISGGYLPTMSPDIFLKEDYIDYVLTGYPWAFKDWQGFKEKHPVKSILTAYHHSGFPENLSLEEGLRFMEDPSTAFTTLVNGKRLTTYFASYHCNNKCPFCFNVPFMGVGGGITKPLDRIIKEIEYILDRYNIDYIESKDNNVFVDPEAGRKFLQYLADNPRMALAGNMDVMVRDFTHENIDILNAAGVKFIFFGLESLRKEVRENLNKTFSMDHLEEIFRYGKKKHIFFNGNILLSIDKSAKNPLTKADIDKETALLSDLLRRHSNLSVEMRLFMPLFGTPIGNKIWEETPGVEQVSLHTYLDMIDQIIMGKKFDTANPLPACYDSMETLDYARIISTALLSINEAKSITHMLEPRSKSLAMVSRLRQRILHYAFDKGLYRFINLEHAVFSTIKNYILKIMKMTFVN